MLYLMLRWHVILELDKAFDTEENVQSYFVQLCILDFCLIFFRTLKNTPLQLKYFRVGNLK